MDRSRLITSAAIALTMLVAVLVFNTFQGRDSGAPARAGLFSIGGRVASADGQLPGGLWIRLTGQQDGRVQSVSVPVAAAGTFTARDLEPGFYTLRAVRRSGDDHQELGSATAMVTDADVTGIVITVKTGRR